ncbi:MAG: valine--tRNA ligase, partial [Acidobacteriota bacterium]|nr:valine--tRNA ligase [Acidobacteriota bacterium]
MSKAQLSKTFEHDKVDPKWYAYWESVNAFRANPETTRPPFSMVLPPPNVTGWLHIGHALNQTLPDIIARWQRMRGFDVLWLPGTDHAGIATQNVVEKQLAAEGTTRDALGREAFEARVRAWAEQSKGTIVGQMQRLGSSVDWSRERFTLDESLSRAVRRVFVSLYKEGLIYRGNYIVNWCPRCSTALSDLEVVHKETDGKLYHVQYAFVDDEGALTIATTRPETMLGDTAIAVNPEDSRYRSLVGRRVFLPIIGRELPIVADEFVDQAFGTGAVKVTPAHDHNDFAIGQRHNLQQISVIDEAGHLTKEAGPYAGQDCLTARRALVERLEQEGFLVKVEDHRHAIGHCQRCDTIVEPLVSNQWFVSIKTLAEPAIDAVKDGRITFVPANWEKTYFEWMANIHDWCISRQLWWGHRIPAWYCEACDKLLVEETPPERCSCGGALRQETDVLDTWFSSALWPFSTMGWPERSTDLERYYPTTLMLTGLDIIFFWVARMIMLGLKFGDDVPFRTVFISSLVRDEQGKKMSKSKGNVVDPLDLMDDIGADALRFTLTALASPGMDIALSEGRLRGSRQFVNKIWNASRFVLMYVNEVERRPVVPQASSTELVHRWILHRVNELAGEVNEALEAYRFDVAADRLYQFFWHDYADWYIELVKPHLNGTGEVRNVALAVLLEVHDRTLRMLHPVVPFITEEVWQQLPRHADAGLTPDGCHQSITLAEFPKKQDAWIDNEAADCMELLQEVITTIRTVRAEWGVPRVQRITVVVVGGGLATLSILRTHESYI